MILALLTLLTVILENISNNSMDALIVIVIMTLFIGLVMDCGYFRLFVLAFIFWCMVEFWIILLSVGYGLSQWLSVHP